MLLEWLHAQSREIRHPGDASAAALLKALQGELTGQPEDVLIGIVAALIGSVPSLAVQTPAFAAALDVVDLGNLTATIPPEPIMTGYTGSVASRDYSLTVHRITPRAANALYGLALRGPAEARRTFFNPLQIKERLAASTEENPYILVADIARSIRAHIRVLCRIVAGLNDAPDEELLAALVAALRAGAIEHKEKGRIAAFAPREENSFGFKAQDRPLAVDVGEALNALRGDGRERVLAAILETDEPLILAQLFPLVSTAAQKRIAERIAALSPSEAGEIHLQRFRPVSTSSLSPVFPIAPHVS